MTRIPVTSLPDRVRVEMIEEAYREMHAARRLNLTTAANVFLSRIVEIAGIAVAASTTFDLEEAVAFCRSEWLSELRRHNGGTPNGTV